MKVCNFQLFDVYGNKHNNGMRKGNGIETAHTISFLIPLYMYILDSENVYAISFVHITFMPSHMLHKKNLKVADFTIYNMPSLDHIVQKYWFVNVDHN